MPCNEELILAIDCSRIGVMLGLYSADFKTVLELNEPNARGEEIAVLLDKLYESCDRSPNNIKTVLVTLGPGSFTGIRAGIAFCEGFCFAKKRNLYGVSTLHALSMHTPKPILHARANYYYVWENGREELVQFDSPPQTHENLPITPFVRLIPALTPSRIQKANYIVNPYEK